MDMAVERMWAITPHLTIHDFWRSAIHMRLFPKSIIGHYFIFTRQWKEGDSYKVVWFGLFSVIVLSVHMVDFLSLSLLLRHVCLRVHIPPPLHAGSLYYIFVEEKWDVAWLESNLALKCSRRCPCYCSACLFMDVFVLWRWKNSLKFHAKNNLVKVCFHLMYLSGRGKKDYNWFLVFGVPYLGGGEAGIIFFFLAFVLIMYQVAAKGLDEMWCRIRNYVLQPSLRLREVSV